MNYLPFSGSWFYGALSGVELAAYYCSYGLLATAPGYVAPTGSVGIVMLSGLFPSSLLGG